MSDLLAKFDAVTMDADNRLAEEDIFYCQAHQTAYNNARAVLAELSFLWEEMLKSQEQLLEGTGDNGSTYFELSSSFMDKRKIEQNLQECHKRFISKITEYFEHRYHMHVSSYAVREALIPKEPNYRGRAEDDSEYEAYLEKKKSLALTYQQIVDQLLVQTGSRSFEEYAVFQIKEACRDAAWNWKGANYERDKALLRLHGAVYGDYELAESGKKIVKGIAHFETGITGSIPYELNPLLRYRGPGYSTVDADALQKVNRFRLFKNGRMDIRFTQEAYAIQFVEAYLGTTQK